MFTKSSKNRGKYEDNTFVNKMAKAKISQFNISYENYVLEGVEGSLTVLRRNISSLPDSNKAFSKSLSRVKTDSEIKSQKNSLSRTSNKVPTKKELDQIRKNAFQNHFLLHTYLDIDQATDILDIPDEIKVYNNSRHATLAPFYRFSLKDLNGAEIPSILTERPINGPLYLLFGSNSQPNSGMTSDSESIDFMHNEDENIPVVNERFSILPLKLTPENKFILIIGIVAGIEFIHRQGFVHGHLNPTNVYLDDNFLPRICGYGFLQPKDMDANQEENHDFGPLSNIAFNAPEVLSGLAIYKESDVYSIGMMIYYIISGMEPFKNYRSHVQMKNICEGTMPSFPECISNDWKNIIIRCCELNPRMRLSSSELLSYLLQEDNIDKFISAIPDLDQDSDSNQLAEDIKDRSGYIDYIIRNFKFNADFQDCYIMREMVPDPTAIDEEVKSLIDKASRNDPESLLKIGQFFLNGERNLPKDEEDAFELILKSADRDNREAMKIVAKLYRDGTGTKKNLEKALLYNKKALKLFEGDEIEEGILNTRIEELEEEIKNPTIQEDINQSYVDINLFDDDDEEKENLSKEDYNTDEKCKIILGNLSSATTKADIEHIFKDFKNINVQINTYSLYKKAYVYFQNEEDKYIFAKIYRNRKTQLWIRGREVKIEGLPKTKREKREENKRKIHKRQRMMSLASVISYKKPKAKHNNNSNNDDENQPSFEIDINDYYPGKNKTEYEKVGEGSFAKAYKIYRKIDDIPLIAKVFTNPFKNRSERNYFARETAALIDINHPMIVKLYGYSTNSIIELKEKLATMIMEYMPNKTLSDVILLEHDKESPFWWNNTTKIKTIIGIAKAMAYVHHKLYVHRDLKPDNIFFDENYEIKIGDFGLSRKLDKQNEIVMTLNIGTPVYIAPEIFDTDNLRYSREVDVYSFGIILYQLLTAKTAKEIYPKKRSVFSLYRFVGEGNRPLIPKGLNPYICDIMKKCWSACIDDRPSFQYIYDIFKKIFEADSPPTTFLPNVDVSVIRDYLKKLDSINVE